MVIDSVNNFGGSMIEVGLQRGAGTFGGMNFVVSHLGTAVAFSNASSNPAMTINSYNGTTAGNYVGNNNSNPQHALDVAGRVRAYYFTAENDLYVAGSAQINQGVLINGNSGPHVTNIFGNVGINVPNSNPEYSLDVRGIGFIQSVILGALTCTGISGFTSGVSFGYPTVQNNGYVVDASGNVRVTGSIAKGSGSFTIDHPVVPSTILVHSFIEGPRCDLIYRNRKQLSNGYAEIDIEKECTANDSTMSPGTFEALCTNPQTFLQNNETFDRVKGYVSSHMLFITCENPESTAMIDWHVIAERHDPFIKKWDMTDSNGLLIVEHPKLV
jgi:hypothetical protein